MGLLDYINNLFPQPSQADIEKLRREVQALKSAPPPGLLSGLLGPSDEELAQMRAQVGLVPAEAPSTLVRLGRGMTDLWEPVQQAYLNATDPTQAQAYRQQRADNERLYDQGMQWANAQPNYLQRDDFWRAQAQQVPFLIGSMMAPAMSVPATAVSLQGTQGAYDALNALRKQLGIGE